MTNAPGSAISRGQRERGPDLHQGQVGHREEVEQRDRHEHARCRPCRRRSPRRSGGAPPRRGIRAEWSTRRCPTSTASSGQAGIGRGGRVRLAIVGAMTFSIVARSDDGESWGVAVASKFLAVGSAVPAAVAGVGAIATQADANLAFKCLALAHLDDGATASVALTGWSRRTRAASTARSASSTSTATPPRTPAPRASTGPGSITGDGLRDPGQHPHRPGGGGGDGAAWIAADRTRRSRDGCSRR